MKLFDKEHKGKVSTNTLWSRQSLHFSSVRISRGNVLLRHMKNLLKKQENYDSFKVISMLGGTIMARVKKLSEMNTMDEIRIRNMDANVVVKLDSMAKKRGMNRSEYLRGVLTNHAYALEVKELDERYQELFKVVIDTIEGNTQILHEIWMKMQGDEK